MIDQAEMDRKIMRSLRGMDVFDAVFYSGSSDPIPCTVTRDTQEVGDEYQGVRVIESAARIGYLVADVANPQIGDWWEFDGKRYTVKDKESSKDSSWRHAHCREDVIDE